MSKQPGPLRRLWYQWKRMGLPWRRKWLAGVDLEGNTFWEFKDSLRSGRHRRIVQYARGTHHGDVQVPPLWMQWLRHTRREPPSLEEQRANVLRIEQMKYLAAQADARWNAKPSALDSPDKQQPPQMLESRNPDAGIRQTNTNHSATHASQPAPRKHSVPDAGGTRTQEGEEEDIPTLRKQRVVKKEPKDSPWKQAASRNPGDDWQPQEWTPGPARKRRA